MLTGAESPQELVALASAINDAFLASDLTLLSEDEVLALLRGREVEARRSAAVDHRLIAEIESRGTALSLAYRNTAALLVDMLRIAPGDATGRVRRTQELTTRRTITGHEVAPQFPLVAEAIAEGAISTRHAHVISATIAKVPTAALELADASGVPVEAELVAQARQVNPAKLVSIGLQVRELLDPDGTLTTAKDHQRRRELWFRPNPDGSVDFGGTLTPLAYAAWRAVLDPLAQPVAEAEGIRDPRTAGQRNHDAQHTACEMIIASEQLPDSGGTPATILVTMTLEEAKTGAGIAQTATGAQVSVAEVLKRCGDAQFIPTVLDPYGALVAFGHGQRLATRQQRFALAARDRGCSAPGCTIPPKWCQVHHVTDWQDCHWTDIQDMALVCPFHHLTTLPQGWKVVMNKGRPEWVPPKHIDPEQKPIRNTANHLPRIEFRSIDGSANDQALVR